MLVHIHWRRSGEMKIIIELTFTSEQETSIYWNRICAWYKNGPRALQLSLAKPESVSAEKVRT